MEVKIDEVELKKLAQEAIFTALSGEKRDALVRDAIAHMLGGKGHIDPSRTPLQEAFEGAVRVFLNEEVKKQLATNEDFKEKLSKVVYKAIDSWIDNTRLPDLIADALAKTMHGRNY